MWGAYWLLLLGNYSYTHKGFAWLARRYRTRVVGLYLGPYPAVVACDGPSIRETLSRPELQGRLDTFVTRERQLRRLLGVFFVDGPFWRAQRRFMLRHMRDQGFGRRSARQEALVAQEVGDILEVLRGARPDRDVFRDGRAYVPDVFCHVFLNALWAMMFGDVFSRGDHAPSRRLVAMGFRFHRNTDPTGAALSLTPWLRYLAPMASGHAGMWDANEYMLRELRAAIDEHLASFSSDHLRDFCDAFLGRMEHGDADASFSVEQLLIVALDLLLPTLTTVTATLSFAVQCLLRHPRAQAAVQAELDAVVGRARLPTLDDRARLPYTEATLREVMRRRPILPLGVAHRATEDTQLAGYAIPKDTMVVTSLYSYHSDPDVFPEPRAFRPERFLDADGKLLKKDLTLPFGAGTTVH